MRILLDFPIVLYANSLIFDQISCDQLLFRYNFAEMFADFFCDFGRIFGGVLGGFYIAFRGF